MIRPVLFNTEMVTAILDGGKTATRRLVKPQPEKDMEYKLGYCVSGDKKTDGRFGFGTREWGGRILYVRPPASVGDILYVRETWSEWTDGYVYKAWASPFPQPGRYSDKMMKWHPSIHMPKEAARIWLKVTDVRAERLQDMSGRDALEEGINSHVHPEADYFDGNQKEMFEKIWNATIKKADLSLYGWDANPWVWVIKFERIEKPEGWCI